VIVEKNPGATQAGFVILYPWIFHINASRFPPTLLTVLQIAHRIEVKSLLSRLEDITALMLAHKSLSSRKTVRRSIPNCMEGSPFFEGNFRERETDPFYSSPTVLMDDELVGILFVNFRQPQRFDATQKFLMRAWLTMQQLPSRTRKPLADSPSADCGNWRSCSGLIMHLPRT